MEAKLEVVAPALANFRSDAAVASLGPRVPFIDVAPRTVQPPPADASEGGERDSTAETGHAYHEVRERLVELVSMKSGPENYRGKGWIVEQLPGGRTNVAGLARWSLPHIDPIKYDDRISIRTDRAQILSSWVERRGRGVTNDAEILSVRRAIYTHLHEALHMVCGAERQYFEQAGAPYRVRAAKNLEEAATHQLALTLYRQVVQHLGVDFGNSAVLDAPPSHPYDYLLPGLTSLARLTHPSKAVEDVIWRWVREDGRHDSRIDRIASDIVGDGWGTFNTNDRDQLRERVWRYLANEEVLP